MVTYKEAGVDIKKAEKLVKKIKGIVSGIGGFSGFYPMELARYKKPFLVASTDGVGTKLKIAQLIRKHNTVGIDLVAMCVNDIITCGAKPMFFLDYFATGKLELGVAEEVIKGIHKGCLQGGCPLIGGETAEMPGFYKKGEYDLAGFCVGIVDRKEVIDGKKIKPGDIIFGLPSSGLHSNGFSLVRKIFSQKELRSLGKELLKPTKIYVKDVLSVRSIVRGIAHITGGGFIDNITRILPQKCQAIIHQGSWRVPQIFQLVQKKGKIKEKEMFHTFNMGIGMVLIVSPAKRKRLLSRLPQARPIGEVVSGRRQVKII
ncbi:Phosphoribosylformylglycinamidine cyclo-ligase [subsurface metagenome]|nr:phosphoribosylformylglycinamidine cyclo-ligase [Clostridia bacterium]